MASAVTIIHLFSLETDFNAIIEIIFHFGKFSVAACLLFLLSIYRK